EEEEGFSVLGEVASLAFGLSSKKGSLGLWPELGLRPLLLLPCSLLFTLNLELSLAGVHAQHGAMLGGMGGAVTSWAWPWGYGGRLLYVLGVELWSTTVTGRW
ncbi:hypothetical protein Dimus_031535, partial [Dionaea muscipula]